MGYIKRSVGEAIREANRLDREKRQLELDRMKREHQLLTDKKKEEIRRMMNLDAFPTASYDSHQYDPYTMTRTPINVGSQGTPGVMGTPGLQGTIIDVNEPMYDLNGVEIKPFEEPQKHVVPSKGVKHHIQVEDVNHTISPKSKSIGDKIKGFLNIKTKTAGPK
jgi:hypothetical protein